MQLKFLEEKLTWLGSGEWGVGLSCGSCCAAFKNSMAYCTVIAYLTKNGVGVVGLIVLCRPSKKALVNLTPGHCTQHLILLFLLRC